MDFDIILRENSPIHTPR